MSQKTKKEILDETAAAYTSSTRAVDKNGFCCYLIDNGCKCAVGRCCENPSVDWKGSVRVIRNGEPELDGEWVNLEESLKLEYRGHEIEFWIDIQQFHDDPKNWDDDGVSEVGASQLALLHLSWDS